jgi:PAS domain S-box-containing protein
VNIEKPGWLAHSEHILEILNEGVVIADESDRILFVNTVFEEMTGIPRAEIIGRETGQLYRSPEDFAAIQEIRAKLQQSGRDREEFFLPTKNGGRVPVVVSARSVAGPGGRRFAVITLTDISEQKCAEEKLRTANTQLEARQKEIEQDLALAARVQRSLEPKSIVWGGISVEAFYHPVRTIGGDFGLISPLDDQHLNLLVCDVSGHGITSALLANRIYSETITQLGNVAPLADMLRHLNRFVMQSIGLSDFFFTLAAARVDRSGRHMVFAGAGHPPAMIVQPGSAPRLLESRSMILGTLPEAVPEAAPGSVEDEPTLEIDLEAGDRIVLYTDGITDVFNSHGDILGIDGVENIVRETSLLPFREMRAGILNRVAAWRYGPVTDDMSLVLVEV